MVSCISPIMPFNKLSCISVGADYVLSKFNMDYGILFRKRKSPHLRRGETMRRRYVTLSDEQQQELRHCRDHHPVPYMRLKPAPILKVAAGQTIKQVPLIGLNKRITQEGVSGWI